MKWLGGLLFALLLALWRYGADGGVPMDDDSLAERFRRSEGLL
jgi:hypothetical protein